jgi:hypothetical protein
MMVEQRLAESERIFISGMSDLVDEGFSCVGRVRTANNAPPRTVFDR